MRKNLKEARQKAGMKGEGGCEANYFLYTGKNVGRIA